MAIQLDSISIEANEVFQPISLLDSVSIEADEFINPISLLDSVSIEADEFVNPISLLDSVSFEFETLGYLNLKVQDKIGTGVNTANVNIEGIDLTTDINGELLVDGINLNQDYVFKITKIGYQNYKHTYNTDDMINKWHQTLNDIVPIIITKKGTVLRNNADDPDNKAT